MDDGKLTLDSKLSLDVMIKELQLIKSTQKFFCLMTFNYSYKHTYNQNKTNN